MSRGIYAAIIVLLLGLAVWMVALSRGDREQAREGPMAGPMAGPTRSLPSGSAGPRVTERQGGGSPGSREVLGPEPSRAEAGVVVLARAHAERGETGEALRLLREAAEEGRGGPELDLERGRIHLQVEDWPAALGAFGAVLASDPSVAEAHFQRAMARVGIEEYAEAIVDMERFLELSSDDRAREQAEEYLQAWNEILHPGEDEGDR